jgi:hypothetical protein
MLICPQYLCVILQQRPQTQRLQLARAPHRDRFIVHKQRSKLMVFAQIRMSTRPSGRLTARSSAKVRIAKFLNNLYQEYEWGSQLNTAPGMLITPSS